MRIHVDAGSGKVDLLDPRVFDAFSATLEHGRAPEQVNRALGALGRFDGRFLWVSVAELRRRLEVGSADEERRFESMVAYAAEHGWTSEDRSMLRAHVSE